MSVNTISPPQLPASHKSVYPHLAFLREEGAVLYGGAGVYFYAPRRDLHDFDFYSSQSVDHHQIISQFEKHLEVERLHEQQNTLVLSLKTSDGPIEVGLYSSLELPQISAPSITSDGVLAVASREDLAATKAKALLERISPGDYCDLATLYEIGADMPRSLHHAQSMFGPEFSPGDVMRAMLYFDDLDLPSQVTESLTSCWDTIASDTRDFIREPPVRSLIGEIGQKEALVAQELMRFTDPASDPYVILDAASHLIQPQTITDPLQIHQSSLMMAHQLNVQYGIDQGFCQSRLETSLHTVLRQEREVESLHR
jgi:hypothetical protein